MTTGASSDHCVGELSAVSTICGHMYSLLGAYAIRDSSGSIIHQLLQVRNPWSYDTGYNGTWNDNDAISWTAANKAQVPYVNNTMDGDIFIEASDYVKYFPWFTTS